MRCLRELCQCSVRCVSVHLTAIERLRGERMCANSGRTHGHNAQEMHKQRKRENSFLVTCDERAPAAAVSGARENLVWALRRTGPRTGQQRLGSSSLNSRQRGTAALQLPDGVASPTARTRQGRSASSHGSTAGGRARLITTPTESATQSWLPQSLLPIAG